MAKSFRTSFFRTTCNMNIFEASHPKIRMDSQLLWVFSHNLFMILGVLCVFEDIPLINIGLSFISLSGKNLLSININLLDRRCFVTKPLLGDKLADTIWFMSTKGNYYLLPCPFPTTYIAPFFVTYCVVFPSLFIFTPFWFYTFLHAPLHLLWIFNTF